MEALGDDLAELMRGELVEVVGDGAFEREASRRCFGGTVVGGDGAWELAFEEVLEGLVEAGVPGADGV